MTGYGTAEGPVGKGRLFIEVKSVNHRFCDINTKFPPKMGALDPLIRRYVQARFARGKIDIFVKEKEQLFGGMKLTIDVNLAKQHQRAFKQLARSLGMPADADMLRYTGVDRFISIEERQGSYEKMWRQVEKLLKHAVDRVVVMQRREGKNLLRDQKNTIDTFAKMVSRMHRETTRLIAKNEERVRQRLAGQQTGIEGEQRVQMEVALLGSRQDIAEELTRLESHIDQYRKLIAKNEPIGRTLDFLLQEMNREINTIGSKAADAVISKQVVQGKALIERLREQVQNVE
jgi:uncharacterized protein (TIGR00255 family)